MPMGDGKMDKGNKETTPPPRCFQHKHIGESTKHGGLVPFRNSNVLKQMF